MFILVALGIAVGTVGMRRTMVLDARESDNDMSLSNFAASSKKITQYPLALTTENEYGLRRSEDYYLPFLRGREKPEDAILIEPFRDTTLRIAKDSECHECTYEWVFSEDDIPTSKDRSPVIQIQTVGKSHITLKEFHAKKPTVVRRHKTFTVYGKYVRRELRQLNDEDRSDFMNAAATLWKTSTVDGKKLYGDRYYDIHYMAIVHNDLAGNSACDFIHGDLGYAFVNAHTALNMMLEQSVQAVNPRLALPYWDYTLDEALLSEQWRTPNGPVANDGNLLRLWSSPIFSADYFGQPNADTGSIQDGQWTDAIVPKMSVTLYESAGLSGHFKTHGFGSCHGQDDDVCSKTTLSLLEETESSTRHQRNSYGLLRAPWNMNRDPKVTRRAEICGSANNVQFPDCTAVHDTYTQYTSFKDYVINLQLSPHGTVHIFTGGAFGECSTSYPALEEILSSTEDEKATYEHIMYKVADIQKNMWTTGMKSCPSAEACSETLESAESCSCSCPALDNSTFYTKTADEMRQTELWLWASWSSGIGGEGKSLSAEQITAIIDVTCNTDTLTGEMVGSNSPLDISFFSTHGEVERMFQRKMLSGTMTDTSWPKAEDNECPGQKASWKNLWFDYSFPTASSGANLESADLTNAEFLKLLDPNSEEHEEFMPYVYGSMEWAHCQVADREITSPFLSDDWIWSTSDTSDTSITSSILPHKIESSSVSQGVQRQSPNCDPNSGPVLDGIDFVHLFENNAEAAQNTWDSAIRESSYKDIRVPPALGNIAPQQGVNTITASFGGYEFWFLSLENQKKFNADPIKYLPRYGGYDAWAMAGIDSSSTSGLNYVDISSKASYDFTRVMRPTFYRDNGARLSMLNCGRDCFAAAEKNFESLAQGSHCFNTQHVEY